MLQLRFSSFAYESIENLPCTRTWPCFTIWASDSLSIASQRINISRGSGFSPAYSQTFTQKIGHHKLDQISSHGKHCIPKTCSPASVRVFEHCAISTAFFSGKLSIVSSRKQKPFVCIVFNENNLSLFNFFGMLWFGNYA